MIAFGCAINSEETWQRCAQAGIRRAAEPDSLVLTRRGYRSLQVPYNEMLAEATCHQDLEAVVLLHQDLEIDGPEFCADVRRALADPAVGVTGTVGARGADSLAWWEGDASYGRVRTFQNWIITGHQGLAGEVDALDGMLLVVSGEAARVLRFDEAMAPLFHGYDIDFCARARDRGFRVTVARFEVSHWARLDLPDRARWMQANVAWRRRRSPRLAWASALGQPTPCLDERG